MRRDMRRCDRCNQLFQLATLLARERVCVTCSRAHARAAMEARKAEVAPLSATGRQRDATATGSRINHPSILEALREMWREPGDAAFQRPGFEGLVERMLPKPVQRVPNAPLRAAEVDEGAARKALELLLDSEPRQHVGWLVLEARRAAVAAMRSHERGRS